jgi:hypothetical protein
MVVDQKSPRSGRYLVVHNIGRGPQMEDVLFEWKIIGHYRYLGQPAGSQWRHKGDAVSRFGDAS